jgi:hypothetical protein
MNAQQFTNAPRVSFQMFSRQKLTLPPSEGSLTSDQSKASTGD